jgi:hypothetical protein
MFKLLEVTLRGVFLNALATAAATHLGELLVDENVLAAAKKAGA